MNDILKAIKVEEFKDDRFYIIFADPNYVDFDSLGNLDWPIGNHAEVIFVACKKPQEAVRVQEFISMEAVEDWFKELKNVTTSLQTTNMQQTDRGTQEKEVLWPPVSTESLGETKPSQDDESNKGD